ncbi:hypothetical protein Aduo_013511 [Ancylostoma duodenale]
MVADVKVHELSAALTVRWIPRRRQRNSADQCDKNSDSEQYIVADERREAPSSRREWTKAKVTTARGPRLTPTTALAGFSAGRGGFAAIRERIMCVETHPYTQRLYTLLHPVEVFGRDHSIVEAREER